MSGLRKLSTEFLDEVISFKLEMNKLLDDVFEVRYFLAGLVKDAQFKTVTNQLELSFSRCRSIRRDLMTLSRSSFICFAALWELEKCVQSCSMVFSKCNIFSPDERVGNHAERLVPPTLNCLRYLCMSLPSSCFEYLLSSTNVKSRTPNFDTGTLTLSE